MGKEFELEEILNAIHILTDASVKAEEEEAPEDEKYSGEALERQGFTEAQIEEIRSGIERKLPVRRYAKSCYNWKQMQEIRLGLLERLDTAKYENPLFSAEQMREIRLGLSDNLEVSAYASLIFSVRDMEILRKNLLSEAYSVHPSGHGKAVVDKESGVSIRISDDCMEAFIRLPKGKHFSEQELVWILNRNDVVFGISKKRLKEAAGGQGGEEEILIAKGTRATVGKDGRYEYFFNPMLPEKPKVKADGSVDYTQVLVADKRNAGDALAKYYPAGNGRDGETVTGIRIKGVHGKEKKILRGQGIVRNAKTNLYSARISGYVVADEEAGSLNVWDVLVVNGNLNRYNGNLNYDGMIHIKGSVSDMVQIEATGSVVVDGYVEGAHIRAGKNIILRRGMNGSGRGVLEAGGSVAGNFFEGVSICAGGNVEGNYFLNCNVMTDKSLIAKGSHSRILGGTVRAGYSVETYAVIKSGKTVIEAGNPLWLEEKLHSAEEKLAKIREEIQQLAEGREKIFDIYGEEAEEKNALFHKICIALAMKEEEEKLFLEEKEYGERILKRAKGAYIKVYCKVEQGVVLSVCGRAKRMEKDMGVVSMFRTEGA